MAGVTSLEFIDTGIHDTDVKSALLNTKFVNVVTIAKNGIANFACDAVDSTGGLLYDSDAACIQAAVDSAKSGDIILIGEGDYILTSRIYQKDKDITIKGIGDVKFVLQTDVGFNGLVFEGSLVGSLTLQADATKYDIDLTVADASSVQVGDLLKIWKNVYWEPATYAQLLTGEMYTVSAVDTVNKKITLSEPLLRDYPLSATVSLAVYRPIQVTIDHIQIQDVDSTTSHSGIVITYGKDVSITDSWFSDSGLMAIGLYSCYNVTVDHNEIHNSLLNGSGYGVAVWNSSAHVTIKNSRIQNCRHCVTGNCSEWKGENRDVVISDNTLIGGLIEGSSCIDSHAVTINYKVTRNKIYPRLSGFYAFYDGTLESEFSDNEVWCSPGANVVGKRDRLGGCTHKITNNIIHDGTVYTALHDSANEYMEITHNTQLGGGALVYFPYTINETYKVLKISDNYQEHGTSQGILISYNATDMDIEINNNSFNYLQAGGIYVENRAASNSAIRIQNNRLRDVNLASNATYNAGIILKTITGAHVGMNIINDSGSLIAYGVKELTGCDSNYIYYNTGSGYGTGAVLTVGANTKVVSF